jgi:hypothetical protein
MTRQGKFAGPRLPRGLPGCLHHCNPPVWCVPGCLLWLTAALSYLEKPLIKPQGRDLFLH